ncbi:helix-turn-helix domain-containing protein [Dongia rigui]|uniref:Helix-turn-helix transcriptional regulator n=1 Tax=Dongia rigui TaxID=940149 RepID=A0ABU5DZD6_9PROT|nr:helix-turn-helix transcriptional regulator [Dongia rigui]MDY0872691.1 helix-turn-helix transcriptional regulator [Dongia rigui]
MPRERKSSGRMASKGFPNPIDVHVGKKLQLRRTLLGMSQERLGTLIGLTFQQIQKYESGANRVSSSRLFDIAQVLDVSIPYFFEGMTSEVEGQSPGHLQGAVPLVTDAEKDPMARRETLELVRAYYQIKSPKVRKNLVDLARSLGKK